jgi:hypothetical protein
MQYPQSAVAFVYTCFIRDVQIVCISKYLGILSYTKFKIWKNKNRSGNCYCLHIHEENQSSLNLMLNALKLHQWD